MNTASAAPVRAENIRRTFGSVVALDDLSLSVARGEIVGLLGPNGAGKTTLRCLINGLRRPDSGTVRIFGRDPREPAARRARHHSAADRAAAVVAGG